MRRAGSSTMRMLAESESMRSLASTLSFFDGLAQSPDEQTALGACAWVTFLLILGVYVVSQLVTMFTAMPKIVSDSVLEGATNGIEGATAALPAPICSGCAVRAEDLLATECFIFINGGRVLATSVMRNVVPTWDPFAMKRGDSWVALWDCSIVVDTAALYPLVMPSVVVNRSHSFLREPVFITTPRVVVPAGQTLPAPLTHGDEFVWVGAATPSVYGRSMRASVGRYLKFNESAIPSFFQDLAINMNLEDAPTYSPEATLWQVIPPSEVGNAFCDAFVLPSVSAPWAATTLATSSGAQQPRGTMLAPPPVLVPGPPGGPPLVPYFPDVTCVTMAYMLVGHRIESRLVPVKPRLEVCALIAGMVSGCIMLCHTSNRCRGRAASHLARRKEAKQRAAMADTYDETLRREHAADAVDPHARERRVAVAEDDGAVFRAGSAPADVALGRVGGRDEGALGPRKDAADATPVVDFGAPPGHAAGPHGSSPAETSLSVN